MEFCLEAWVWRAVVIKLRGHIKLTLSQGGGEQHQYEIHPIGECRMVSIFHICLAKFGMLACKHFHSVQFVPCGIPWTTTRQLPWSFPHYPYRNQVQLSQCSTHSFDHCE
ncbi:hypothetical protein PITC_041700 [Penicillium italicum]|uniref:Uncharacterized protein n=1 Tax=Penicillium italicum TaxID=40296 RepID=A0A0A2KDI9_PENIT|nr:hypothetical protein PITC_041700 [Penicillium italicum]